MDWWRDHVDSKVDALAITKDKLAVAVDAKRLFMLKEGIKEEREDQLKEPEETFDLFSKEAKDIVFETDDSEEGAEAQRALQYVTRYVTKKHEEKKAQGNKLADHERYDDIDIDDSSEDE